MCEEVYGLHGVASDVQHHLFFFIGQVCKCMDGSEHIYVFLYMEPMSVCDYYHVLLILFINLNNKHVMSGIGHSYIVVVISTLSTK